MTRQNARQYGRFIVTNRIALPVEPPSRILICPWGNVESKNGNFVFDAESASAVMAEFTRHGVALPIDVEHQTMGGEFAAPDGSAPAVGWILSLEPVEGDGLYATVEWTARGAQWIAEKAYRYLSPVTLVRKHDRRVVGLHSVGLTNIPAIAGMKLMVNKETDMNEYEKLLTKLRGLAGVGEDADEDAVIAALTAALATDTEASSARVAAAICKAAGVSETADVAAVVAAINSARATRRPDMTGFVPKAEFDVVANSLRSASEKLTALEARSLDRESAERIAAAKAAGKLTDAMLTPNSAGKNYFSTLARDETAWTEWFERTPVIAVPNGRVVTGGGANPASGSGDRMAIIHKAKAEFEASPEIATITNKAAFVADALREAKLSPALSEDEKKLVS